MICRQCGYRYDGRTVGFSILCENCGEYLHTCFNCTLYNPDSARCRSHTTEAVRDVKGKNHCEEFIPNTDIVQGREKGREENADPFNNLFNVDGE